MYQALSDKKIFAAGVTGFILTLLIMLLVKQPALLLLPFIILGMVWMYPHPKTLFYILLASIPWSAEMEIRNFFSTDFPDEFLMIGLTFLLVIRIIADWKQPASTLFRSVILYMLAFQLLWIMVSCFSSTEPLISTKYLIAKSWYYGAFVIAPLLLLKTKNDLVTAVYILTTSTIIVAMVSVIRHAYLGFSFAEINHALTPFFRNHVNYSALLVCVLPLTILYYYSRRRGSRAGAGLIILGLLLAIYLSFSRGAWLAILTGGLSFGLIKFRLLFRSYIVAVCLFLFAVGWLAHENRYLKYAHDFNTTIFHRDFRDHLIATYQLKDLSTAERFNRWVAGVRMVKENPFTGFGPGSFFNRYKPFTITSFKTWVSSNPERSTVHNYFLLVATEQGLFGLILLLVLLGVALFVAEQLYHQAKDPFWKYTAAASGVILSMICTINLLSDMIETDKIGSLFYVALSVLVIAHYQSAKDSDAAAHIKGIS